MCANVSHSTPCDRIILGMLEICVYEWHISLCTIYIHNQRERKGKKYNLFPFAWKLWLKCKKVRISWEYGNGNLSERAELVSLRMNKHVFPVHCASSKASFALIVGSFLVFLPCLLRNYSFFELSIHCEQGNIQDKENIYELSGNGSSLVYEELTSRSDAGRLCCVATYISTQVYLLSNQISSINT